MSVRPFTLLLAILLSQVPRSASATHETSLQAFVAGADVAVVVRAEPAGRGATLHVIEWIKWPADVPRPARLRTVTDPGTGGSEVLMCGSLVAGEETFDRWWITPFDGTARYAWGIDATPLTTRDRILAEARAGATFPKMVYSIPKALTPSLGGITTIGVPAVDSYRWRYTIPPIASASPRATARAAKWVLSNGRSEERLDEHRPVRGRVLMAAAAGLLAPALLTFAAFRGRSAARFVAMLILTVVALLAAVTVRSYSAADELVYRTGRFGYEFWSHRGRLNFVRFDGWDEPQPLSYAAIRPEGRSEERWSAGAWPTDRKSEFLGLRHAQGTLSEPGLYSHKYQLIVVPPWALAVPLLPFPILWLRRAIRRKRRRHAGLCERCGYDVRATPGRCPECGDRARPAAATVTGPCPEQGH